MAIATEERTTTVHLSDLNLDETIQLREHLNEDAVERYMESFDSLPPIRVVETETHGKVIGDGYHRVTAAVRLGRPEINATITPGTMDDAWYIAITENLAHGVPLTSAEKQKAVLSLAKAGFTQAEIARCLAYSEGRVSEIVNRQKDSERIGVNIRDHHVAKIVRKAPEDIQKPLAEALNDRGSRARELLPSITKYLDAGDSETALEIAREERNAEGELVLIPGIVAAEARRYARNAPGSRMEFTLLNLGALIREAPEPAEWINTWIATDSPESRTNADKAIHEAKQYLTKVQDALDAPERIVS